MEWTMTNVLQLIPRVDDQPSSSDQLLFQTISILVALTTHTIALERRIADQAERIAALEARSPAPPFEIPSHWVVPKTAAYLSGYSLPTIYRFFHRERIRGVEHGGAIFIDPDTLPKNEKLRKS
jgi:hypothetical protein